MLYLPVGDAVLQRVRLPELDESVVAGSDEHDVTGRRSRTGRIGGDARKTNHPTKHSEIIIIIKDLHMSEYISHNKMTQSRVQRWNF